MEDASVRQELVHTPFASALRLPVPVLMASPSNGFGAGDVIIELRRRLEDTIRVHAAVIGYDELGANEGSKRVQGGLAVVCAQEGDAGYDESMLGLEEVGAVDKGEEDGEGAGGLGDRINECHSRLRGRRAMTVFQVEQFPDHGAIMGERRELGGSH